MKTVRLLALSLAAGLVALAATPGSAPAAAPTNPTLTGIRAAHHPGFDRIVFQFTGGLPASRRARYVDQLIGDGSGQPIRIAGRAILRVRFAPAQAHNASGQPTVAGRKTFALPNIMTAVRSGDFEAVTSYGIGLAKRTSFHVSALRNPSRVVVDVKAAFPTVNRRVFFFNSRHFTANQPPFFSPRLRPVRTTTPATGLMDRLFAGVLPGEHADGLRLLRSDATGFSHLSIGNRIARVRLTGGCNSHGSTVTIAGEIMPTLRQLRSVDWVKIYDPAGHTERPTGHSDSIPTCLEP
ncbi:MAG: AMIN-like domain-containing (lipo)protein [Nocardioidaceae bacterium]